MRTIKALPPGEFALLMAMLMATAALAIDAMLPALGEIGGELGVERENARQLVISALFLGFGLGQLLYGPLADRLGRKPGMYIGLGLFVFGCLLSMAAWSYPAMLAGRFLQGVGAAGPRIVTLALIRDRYQGREMARVMSFVFAVFVIVPTIAPGLGQVVLMVAGWRAIFGALLAFSMAGLVWFVLRQPETLSAERRIPLSVGAIAANVFEVGSSRRTVAYTLAAGAVFGGFIGYLNSAQQIFQDQYQVGTLFPVYFAALSLAFAAASVVNGRLVLQTRHAQAFAAQPASVVRVIRGMLRGHPAGAGANAPVAVPAMGRRHFLLSRRGIQQRQRAGHGAVRSYRRNRGGADRLVHVIVFDVAGRFDRPVVRRYAAAPGGRVRLAGIGVAGRHALG